MCTLFVSAPDFWMFPYLRFDLVVSEAEVLEVGGRIGLHRWELMLQHLDHLWQLWVPPAELPEDTDTRSGCVQGSPGLDCRPGREQGGQRRFSTHDMLLLWLLLTEGWRDGG